MPDEQAIPFRFDDDMLRKREPFAFNPSGRRGILCIHGFTGSPYEVRPMGEYFAARGWRVEGVLLPGHGELPERLSGMRWTQWFAHARAAFERMSAECDDVFVAGLSMGGLITLYLAAQEARNMNSSLRAVAALAAPAGLIDKRARLVHIAHPFVRWFRPFQYAPLHDPVLQQRIRKNFGNAIDLDDPGQINWLKRNLRIPLNAVSQLLRFNDVVLRVLPEIQVPVYIAQGDADSVIARDSAEVVHARLRAQPTVLRRFPGWQHEMPLEDDATSMFDDIAAFFERVGAHRSAPNIGR
jgi:carboxylesterase